MQTAALRVVAGVLKTSRLLAVFTVAGVLTAADDATSSPPPRGVANGVAVITAVSPM